MANFVDMLSSPKSFSNPAADAITRVNSVLNDTSTKLTALKTASDAATTAPEPPATTPVAITISNLGLLKLQQNTTTVSSRITQMQTFKKHTDALSNVNPGDSEPSYNHALSASSSIQNAQELKAQAQESNIALDPSFNDVFTVADMDIDSIMGSVSADQIASINAKVTDIESHASTMTEYDSLLAAFNARNKSESERIITLYAPKLNTLMTKLTELNQLTIVRQQTDTTNYQTVKAVAEKLSTVAMMFAGMNDPLVGKLMGNISK